MKDNFVEVKFISETVKSPFAAEGAGSSFMKQMHHALRVTFRVKKNGGDLARWKTLE